MLLLAILSDLTGPFGAVIGGGSILICQYLMGVPPISFKPKQAVKKTINLLGNAVGEAATAGIFPSITVYTAFTIAWARLEDKTGISIPNPGTTKKPTNMRQLREKMTMRNCTKKLPSYILALLLLFSAYGAQAQTQADFQDKNINVQLSLSTEAPAPGQVVRATVNAFSEDIDAALISWYVNGTRSAQALV